MSCDNCGIDLTSLLYPDAHIKNCKRLYEKCGTCLELIHKDEIRNHFLSHFCKLCGVEKKDNHYNVCDEVLVCCVYCDYELKRSEMFSHEYDCGSQTVVCNCGERVIKRLGENHLLEKHNTRNEIHLKAFYQELHTEFPLKYEEEEMKNNGKITDDDDIIQKSIMDEIERQERLNNYNNDFDEELNKALEMSKYDL